MVYKTKSLISQRGQFIGHFQLNMENGRHYKEVGSSQSVNVKRHITQMVEEALLNALYKINNRTGDFIFNKKHYSEQIGKYVKDYKLTNYTIHYFEDRLYTYRRVTKTTQQKGVIKKQSFVQVRRKGRFESEEEYKTIKKVDQEKIKEKII